MAINTGGFSVDSGMIPRLQQVNPAMASVDPGNLLAGYQQGIEAQQKASELAAYQQHAPILTNILEQQAKQHTALAKLEAIKAETANQTQKDEIDSLIKGFQEKGALSKYNTGLTGIRTGLLEGAKGLGAQMTAEQEAATGGAQFKAAQQPTIQKGEAAIIAAKSEAAPDAAAKIRLDAQYALQSAKGEYDRLLKEGSTTEQQLKDAEVKFKQAQAKYYDAYAQERAEQNKTRLEAAKIRADSAIQAHQNSATALKGASDTYKIVANDLEKMENAPATNPADPADSKYTLGRLAQDMETDPTGMREKIKKLFNITDPKAPVPTSIQRRLDNINEMRDQLAELRKHMFNHSKIMDKAAIVLQSGGQEGATGAESSPPPDSFASPEDVKAAVMRGDLDPKSASAILVDKFGFAP